MSELHRSLAANVKTFRNRRGWSQAQLAERAGLSVSYVGDIEGALKWPSADKLEALAKALRTRAYLLLLTPEDTRDYHDWLERRDLVTEMGERLFEYFEKRRT